MRRFSAIILGLLSAVPALADTVSISPSAAVIPQGGTAAFTVTVSPGTYVQSVTVTYQGESGSDVLTSAPYVASRQFNTPARNKLVTATVAYSNGAPNDVATTTIDIIGISLTGSGSVTRGMPASYTFKALPAGTSITRVDWTYSVNTMADTDGNDNSTWAGTMVLGGTIQCSATILGLTFNAEKAVTVNDRNWTTPITCAQDNEADYGNEPILGVELGMNRDRDGNIAYHIFVPRSGDEFTPAITRSRVTTGPCAGWWYVTSTTLKCQRETVINKYIKSSGPALGGENFYGRNDAYCIDAAAFVQAVKNHEYRGTPETPRSSYGHQGLIEYAIQIDLYDPRKHLEPSVARSDAALCELVTATVLEDENAIFEFAAYEDQFSSGPNWGLSPSSLGSGMHSKWSGTAWTDCVYGPLNF